MPLHMDVHTTASALHRSHPIRPHFLNNSAPYPLHHLTRTHNTHVPSAPKSAHLPPPQIPDPTRNPEYFETHPTHFPAVPSALDATHTMSLSAQPLLPGTRNTIPLSNKSIRPCGPRPANSYARLGKETKGAVAPDMTTSTSVQGVVQSCMVLKAALEHRRSNPTTPYIAEAWDKELKNASLLPRCRD
jgi:hypothetical protein